MTFDDVLKNLQTKFGAAILGKDETKPDASIKVDGAKILEIAQFLKAEQHFESLSCVSGVDYPQAQSICVVYHFFSYTHKLMLPVKVTLPRPTDATGTVAVPSLCSVYKGANWLERETYDLIGVTFTGHPEHRRILCPEDWVGYPMRKDYKTPDYYNGMPVPLYFEDTDAPASGGTH